MLTGHEMGWLLREGGGLAQNSGVHPDDWLDTLQFFGCSQSPYLWSSLLLPTLGWLGFRDLQAVGAPQGLA